MSFLRRRRWTGNRLEELRQDYCDTSKSLTVIARKWETSPGAISRLATLHNWPSRYIRGAKKFDRRIKLLSERRERMKAEIRRLNDEITDIDRRLYAIRNFTRGLYERADNA